MPKDNEKLAKAMEAIKANHPKSGSLWRHIKSDSVYLVMYIGVRESTVEPDVAYMAFDEAKQAPKPPVWFRPLADFLDGRFVTCEEARKKVKA